jgi:ral guanine nucleotide dissociation stimulator-like 1
MSHITIAEQLTIIDAVCLENRDISTSLSFICFKELLKRVLPHECLTLGANGNNRRGLNSNRILTTVDKTIEQFNAVVNRVVATILKEQNEQLRVRVIEKWIDIAHQCRQFKNFSSLTAIINGLLSGSIYRLKSAWSHVNVNHCSILNRLKSVFGSCDDRKEARAILDKVS